MTGHVDSETIAAFRENLLPADEAAGVAAHLSSCLRCAEIDAQLAAVTTILAATPRPPMPTSVAARLDAALAAEIARSAQAASPAAAVSPADPAAPAATDAARSELARPADVAGAPGTAPLPGRPGRGGRAGRPRVRREATGPGRDAAKRGPGRSRAPSWLSLRLAAAAAAVVIVAGGGYAIARVASGGNSSVTAGSAGSTAAQSRPSASSHPAQAPEAAPRAPVAGALPVVATGTVYRARQLPAQVRAVLSRYPAPLPSRAAAPEVSPSFPGLATCVSAVAHGQHPRLVDIAHYGSRRAAVIVVPAGPARLRVLVVGTDCSVIARSSVTAPG